MYLVCVGRVAQEARRRRPTVGAIGRTVGELYRRFPA
jgi:hypothetical protein